MDVDVHFILMKECQKKLEHKLGLDSYLLKPVQRLTKYQLLLKVSCIAVLYNHGFFVYIFVCIVILKLSRI